MPRSPFVAVKQVVNSAVTWVDAREHYRKLLDSKKAEDTDLNKAKKRLAEASNRLEKAVLTFKALHESYKKLRGRPKGAFPWKEFFGMISGAAAAVEQVMQPPGAPGRRPRPIIDVQAEVVDPKAD